MFKQFNTLRHVAVLATAVALAACADEPAGPQTQPTAGAQFAALPVRANEAIATLQRVTARYHHLDAAIADNFVLLHPCENRPGEGPVGIVYVNFDRLLDGVIDPQSPDALIYEPSSNGKPKLVGAEFAIPYAMAPQAPSFLGTTFQPEDEFGVWALHAWIWRANPEGMFAETNPRVSCGEA
jgi:hypothetical protein